MEVTSIISSEKSNLKVKYIFLSPNNVCPLEFLLLDNTEIRRCFLVLLWSAKINISKNAEKETMRALWIFSIVKSKKV